MKIVNEETEGPPHLGFAQRKSLIARSLLYESVHEASDVPPDVVGSVCARIRQLLEEDARAEDDGQSLEDYLHELSGRADSLVASYWPTLEPPVREWLDRFLALIRDYHCCGGDSDRCRGYLSDGDAVLRHGYAEGGCLHFVREAYDEMVDLVTAIYEAHLPGSTSGYTVRLGTRRGAADTPLTGITLPDPSCPQLSTVVLEVTPACLDERAYGALRYVLCHECFVHAFQARGEGRASFPPGEPFAEGWLDWLAMAVLEQHYVSLIETHEPPGVLRWYAQMDCAAEYHGLRFRTGVNSFASTREMGRQAARLLEAFVSNTPAVATEDALLFRLSLEVNTRISDTALRSSFVYAVRGSLTNRGTSGATPERALLEYWLRRYARAEATAEEVVHGLARTMH